MKSSANTNGRSLLLVGAVFCFLTALISAVNYWWSIGNARVSSEHRAYIDRLVTGEEQGPWMIQTTKASVEANTRLIDLEKRVKALEAK